MHGERSRTPFTAAALAGVALLASLAAPALADGPGVDPKAAFERLKTLAGTWQGPAGHGPAAQQATVVYRVASGGTAVEETLFPDTPHEMVSMYHLASGQLLMTHYCAMGNQPRLKLDAAASTRDRLVFAFDGGTNFDPARDGHVHAGVVEWKGDALHNDWTFWAGGKESNHAVFDLRRK